MISRATTTISVLSSAVTVNDLGDEIENIDVNLQGIPASIIEQTRDIKSNATQTPRITRTAIGRVASNVPISTDNRIKDERTGTIYLVLGVSSLGNPVRSADLRLELQATTTS